MAIVAKIFVLICLTCSINAEDVVVNTEYGPVRGYVREYANDSYYVSYRGVPFADQPVGEKRFLPLQAPDVWTDVYNASTEGPMCLQPDTIYGSMRKILGESESCIYANIHVPLDGTNSTTRPVLVFMHGGGFSVGSGSSNIYGPEYLMASNVILVTFNYRLGLFGFLSLGIPEVPGNIGLKDAAFLLKWVQRNIAAFGGDPDNVTIFGHSAGSVCAHLLTLSPMASGLFNKAILSSGNALGSSLSYSAKEANVYANEFAALLNITSTDPYDIYNALISADLQDLADASQTLIDRFGIQTFAPVIEQEFENVEAFLLQSPLDIILNNESSDVPTLLGFIDEEGNGFYKRLIDIDILSKYMADKSVVIPNYMKYTASNSTLEYVEQSLLDYYFNDSQPMIGFVRYSGESYITYSVIQLAELYSLYHKSPTYLYLFSQVNKLNVNKWMSSGKQFIKAGHLDDITHLFKCNVCNVTIEKYSPEEYSRDRMVAIISNFVNTGNPTPKPDVNLPLIWPPTDALKKTYMELGVEMTVKDHPRPEMEEFWNQLYEYVNINN